MADAVIPIVFAEVAGSAHGRVIGFMNTSRFAANAAGPLIATALFAHGSPFGLYLGLSAFTLLALLLFLGVPAASAARSSSSKIAVLSKSRCPVVIASDLSGC